MREPSILILSDPDDVTVRMVVDRIPSHVDLLWWDDHDFPSRATLRTSIGRTGVAHVLTTADGRYDLRAVRAGWLRRPNGPAADAAVTDPTQRAFAEQVAGYCLTGVWRSLDAEWLPAEPHSARAADNKICALLAAQRAGLDVPQTVVTNGPEDLVSAWSDLDGALVAKSPLFRPVQVDGRPRHLFTVGVQQRDLIRRRSLRYAPLMLQRNVPKAVELRVTVVGRQAFPAEIIGSGSSRGKQDWRRSYGHGLRYAVHALPPAVTDGCLQVAEQLGLNFGAIDLILTPEGRYVFLEINAGGQWAWIETETGLPIAAAIADWLLRRAGRADD